MIPDFPRSRPLRRDDHGLLDRLYRELSPGACDLSPANLRIWRDCTSPSLTSIHGNLCIMMEPHSEPACFLEPLGTRDLAAAVRACLDRTGRITRTGASLAAMLPPEEFDVRPLRDHFDYIYRVRELAELKGKKFDGKRNHLKKFARLYPGHDFRPLEQKLFSPALALFERWAEVKEVQNSGAPADATFHHECQRRALENAFADYERLGLFGGALVFRGEVHGFIIASSGAPGTAIAHFQYASAGLPGVSQTLLWEACRHLFGPFTFLNMEEDLGLPGLRKTKLSYHPCHLIEKFEIQFRGQARIALS